ncbi:hypothetical protein TNCV_1063051 [Trichonephila clavipes]|nr:hypothetical protein TNCV_1063051 [Trichonephila clavipes]
MGGCSSQWSRKRTGGRRVTSSSLVPPCRGAMHVKSVYELKRPHIGVVVRRGGASSSVVLVTGPWFKITRSIAKSHRVV